MQKSTVKYQQISHKRDKKNELAHQTQMIKNGVGQNFLTIQYERNPTSRS